MPAPEVTGRITANFECVRGETQLRESYCAAPLKIAKTFPLQDGQIGLCIMDSSPGLLTGDSYQLAWCLDAGARVFLTNQAYTKVHPSLVTGSYQAQHIKLKPGALLEYMPEPVMLYRDAALHSECNVQLDPGSTLLLSEILCAGRVSRNEIFQFRAYESLLRVHYAGNLIFHNRTHFYPATQNLRTLAAWHNCTHWGNCYLFSAQIRECHVEAIRQVTAQYPQLLSGVSFTHQHDVAVSVLGHRAWDIQQLFGSIRQVVRASSAF
ncbi:MAG: urease accessory protein UreD [Abitibacteriaceae bacterium]|nr:urease accessory protein UreD [Abditibacteriaceae bacterium]